MVSLSSTRGARGAVSLLRSCGEGRLPGLWASRPLRAALSLGLRLRPPFYKDACGYIGPTWTTHVSHSTQRLAITPASPPLPCRVTCTSAMASVDLCGQPWSGPRCPSEGLPVSLHPCITGLQVRGLLYFFFLPLLDSSPPRHCPHLSATVGLESGHFILPYPVFISSNFIPLKRCSGLADFSVSPALLVLGHCPPPQAILP